MKLKLIILIIFLVFPSLVYSSGGVPKTWNAGSGNWSEPLNWTPTGVPTIQAYITNSVTGMNNITVTMDLSSGTTISSLTMTPGTLVQGITTYHTLNLSGNINIGGNLITSSNETINLGSYTALLKGHVTVTGAVTSTTGELNLGTTAILFTHNLYAPNCSANIRISNTATAVSLLTSITCKNLIIDSGATLIQGNSIINISGNLAVDGEHRNPNNRQIRFIGGTVQSVSVANNQTLGQVETVNLNTVISLLNSAIFTKLTIASGTIFKSTAPGITLTMNNTSYVTVNKGTFSLTGSSENHIVLTSSSEESGSVFSFRPAIGSTVSLSYVSIRNCSAFSDINAQNNCTDLGGNTNIDFFPPAALTNLAATTGVLPGEINLTWTAPGDDNWTGTAANYIVKYSMSAITDQTTFDSASTYTQSWTSVTGGQAEYRTMSGLVSGTIYYISIKAVDNLTTSGGLSNTTGNSAAAKSGKFWNNNAGGNWSVDGNWEPTGVPVAADDIVIPTSVSSCTIVMDIAEGTTVTSFAMKGGNVHTLNLAGNLNVTGQLTISSVEKMSLGAYNAAVKGNIAVTGSVNSTTGELQLAGTTAQNLYATNCTANIKISNTSATVSLLGNTNCKNLIINSGTTLNQGSYNLAIRGNLTINGTYLKGAGNLDFNEGIVQGLSVLNNQNLGNVRVSTAGTVVSLLNSASFDSITLLNSGSFKNFTAGTTVTMNNGSYVSVNSGSFILTGTGGSNVAFKSFSDGTTFSFNRTAGNSVVLSYVKIRDCNAGSGAKINAHDNCTDLTGNINVDFYAPSAITNLTASTGIGTGEINLTWTATGDDTVSGTAAAYIVKYSASNITSESDFNSADLYAQTWNPIGSGGTENRTISGLNAGALYYVSIKAADSSGGGGGISNTTGNSATSGSFGKTWINSDGGSWKEDSNWEPVGKPTETDDVYIVNLGSGRTITIDMDEADGVTIKSLTINNNGPDIYDLRLINGNINIARDLTTSGKSDSNTINIYDRIIAVQGNVNSAGAYIYSDSGELILNGTDGDQSLLTANCSSNIRISNTAGTVSLSGEVSSKNFIIDSDAVLSQGSYNLKVNGDMEVNGTYLKGAGILNFNNGADHLLSVNNNQNLGNIDISNTGTRVFLQTSANFSRINVMANAEFQNSQPGTTVSVDVGGGITVNPLGTFISTGSSGNNVVLQSNSSGSRFIFVAIEDLENSPTVNLSYVSIKDCDGRLPGGMTCVQINALEGCIDLGNNIEIEFPPAPITNLSASTGGSEGQINLSWTAVGDDWNTGSAAIYIVKYSTSNIATDAQFNSASTYTQTWTPKAAGLTETKILSGLIPGTIYYISVKAQDNLNKKGSLSNATGNSAIARIEKYWNAGSGNWSDPNNWSPAGVPTLISNVVVPTSIPACTITMDIADGTTIASLTMNGVSGNPHVLNLSGNLEMTGVLSIATGEIISLGSCTAVVKEYVLAYGSIYSSTGELKLAGTAAQSLCLYGSANIKISNTLSTVTLSSSTYCKNLVIDSGAVFSQGNSSNLFIAGDLTISGTGVFIKSGSLPVIFNGGTVQSISLSNNQNLGRVSLSASNTVVSLLSNASLRHLAVMSGATFKNVTAGTTIAIEDSYTITVYDGGVFSLTGTSGNNIVLQPTSSTFNFSKALNGTVALNYVSIKGCDATDGYEINAQNNCTDLGSNINVDFFAPSSITNLTASPGYSMGKINLTWEATGDDTTNGTASSYIIKYSASPITTLAQFDAATVYSQGWNPIEALSSEGRTLSGLTPAALYYISIKAVDGAGGTGGLSNTTGNSAVAYDGGKTWVGTAGDYNWQTAGNWSPPSVPEDTDNVIINTATSKATNVYGSINSLTMGTAGACTLYYSPLGALTVLASSPGGITVGANGYIDNVNFDIKGNLISFKPSLLLNNLTLSGTSAQTLSLPSASVLSIFTMSNTSATVTLDNSPGITLFCNNIIAASGTNIQVNSQTIRITGDADFSGALIFASATSPTLIFYRNGGLQNLTATNNTLANIIVRSSGIKNTLNLIGNLKFYNLTIENISQFQSLTAGTTISVIPSGNGITVKSDCSFLFAGSYGEKSVLKSLIPGQSFKFYRAADETAVAKFAYVDISYCNASGGTIVYVPLNCSIDSNTSGVSAVDWANAKTWDGETDNVWSTAGNWDDDEAPTLFDDIIILAGSNINSVSGTIASLTVYDVSSLTITNIFTVNGNCNVGNGNTFTSTSGMVYVKGDLYGSNILGTGTLNLSGKIWQSINWQGDSWDISVSNTSSDEVAVSADMKCKNFILGNCRYNQGNYNLITLNNLTFNSGSIFTISSANDVSVGGIATVNGSASFGRNLIVAGNLSINSTISSAGDVTVGGSLTIGSAGSCSFGNNLKVTGSLTSSGTCALGAGSSIVNDNFILNGGGFNQNLSNLNIIGKLAVNSGSYIHSLDLGVGGNLTVNGSFSAGSGNINLAGSIYIASNKFTKGTGTVKFISGNQTLNASGNDLGFAEINGTDTIIRLNNNVKFTSLLINTGASLVCSTPSKTITLGETTINGTLNFSASKITLLVQPKPNNGITISQSGRFNLTGTTGASNYIAFLSAQSGNQCKLNTYTSNASLKYVSIKDCDASSGEQIEGISCIDLGNNLNIFFGAQPPGTINDLKLKQTAGSGNIEVKWTAVGTEGNRGKAKEYIVKYSSVNITTQEQFDSANIYVQNWSPKLSGENESYIITGLSAGTDIWFVSIETKNFAGLQGDISQISEFTVQIDPARTIVYSLPGERGNVNIEIPQGAFTQSVEITGRELNSSQMPAVSQPEFKGTGLGASFSISTTEKIKQPLKLKIKYETKDIEGLNAEKLRIAFYNDIMGKWYHIKSNVDSSNRRVCADLKHLTAFRVVEYTYLGLSTVKVFPNPWKIGTAGNFDNGDLTFKNLPEKGRIKIYNVAGEMVRDINITEVDDGFYSWNGTNDAGRKVSSGVYIAYIQDEEGNHRIIKIAVIR